MCSQKCEDGQLASPPTVVLTILDEPVVGAVMGAALPESQSLIYHSSHHRWTKKAQKRVLSSVDTNQPGTGESWERRQSGR